jgi:sigma-B regulation protein RsbU (phosphoserine phosphatase)
MTLRSRLLAVILLATAGSVLLTAGTLAVIAWNTMVNQALGDAATLARLLARISSVAEGVPIRIEALVAEEREGTAYALAHLVDEARTRGVSPEELRRRLTDITAKTPVQEVRVLGPDGNTVASSLDDVTQPIADDATLQRSGAFASLLGNEAAMLSPPGGGFEVDQRPFSYLGARTATSRDSVLLAYDGGLADLVRNRIGLGQMVRSLLSGRAVDAVWVLDDDGAVVAASSLRDPAGTERPAEQEDAIAAGVLADGADRTELTRAFLTVASPVFDPDGIPAGAVLLRLPTAPLIASLLDYLYWVAGISIVLIAAGWLLAHVTAKRIAEPIGRITASAARIDENRAFDPGELSSVQSRPDEIGRLARVFTAMAVDLIGRERQLDELVRQRTHELEVKNDELQTAYRQIDDELTTARHLQAAILPQRFGDAPDYACSAMMVPARQLAGDFYDVIPIGERYLAVLVADVSGKGVPAAFFMGISRTVLQQTARSGPSPSQCLGLSNVILCGNNPLDLFVTVFIGVLDRLTGEFTYANGGHNPPLLVRADGSMLELPSLGSPPLGAFEEIRFIERSVQLDPGDTLILYTDGITEAQDLRGELFGEARLEATIEGAQHAEPADLLRKVTESVGAFVGSAPVSDDITCLVLRYTGSEARIPAAA